MQASSGFSGAPDGPIGWVGLGRMGAPMCRRLLSAGLEVTVWDLADDAMASAAGEGARAAASIEALARSCPVVVLMLPDSIAVEAVFAEGLGRHMRPGSVLVDMSSSDPESTRVLAATLADRDVGLVDAPVARGVAAARTGELSIFVGGAPADVERVKAVLTQLGTDLHPMGPVGCGHSTKALNNLLNATSTAVACEVALTAVREGLDLERFLQAVNSSSGRSYATEVKLPRHVLSRTFDSGFTTGLMNKDAHLGARIVQRQAVPSSISPAVASLWQRALEHVGATSDHTELFRLLQDLAVSQRLPTDLPYPARTDKEEHR